MMSRLGIYLCHRTTVSPRGHLFYVDFLFFIFTSHRGGNVSTAVRTFPPR